MHLLEHQYHKQYVRLLFNKLNHQQNEKPTTSKTYICTMITCLSYILHRQTMDFIGSFPPVSSTPRPFLQIFASYVYLAIQIVQNSLHLFSALALSAQLLIVSHYRSLDNKIIRCAAYLSPSQPYKWNE